MLTGTRRTNYRFLGGVSCYLTSLRISSARNVHIIIFWLIVRLVTWLLAVWFSALQTSTEIERTVQVWPISGPLKIWLEKVFLSPWLHWDTAWFLKIVLQGYRVDDGTAQFHPLYPWLASLLFKIGFHPLFSLLLVSSVSTLLLLLSFEKLARLDLSPKEAFTSLTLFLFFPTAFILFAPYTEATFLLFAVLCVYFARKSSWFLAGLMGGLASLTRQQGIFLLIPLLIELWEATKVHRYQFRDSIKYALTLGLVPAGYLIWMIYRAIALSDLQPNFDNINSFIYSIIISPSAHKVVAVQAFIWPWQAFRLVLEHARLTSNLSYSNLFINLLFAVYFILLLSLSWRKMRVSYRLYSFAIIVLSLCYYTGPIYPYMGLPRHLLLAFPVYIGLGTLARKPGIRLMLVGFNMVGFFFLEAVCILNGWIP